ncbi:MAG TPA: phospholipase D-like domain-containing protein [Bradyrhizobium sp.]
MNDVLDAVGRLRSDVQLAIGLVIAVIVTVHVLLTKREVAAAAGWIGLAWLAPFFGGFIYFMLGINRVQRRARQARGSGGRQPRRRRDLPPRPGDDGHLRPLGRGISFITDRLSEPGNSVRVLHNGDEAYPAMLAAIGAARASIGLTSYIMRHDAIGDRFISALQAAKDRGVEVRVIVDGVGSGWILSPAYRRLRRAGVPAKRFMHSPLPWRMPFLNLRTHKKILVVDGKLGFTGGINIADQNVLATKPRNPVQDTHFQIEGPVVAQLAEAFGRDWSFLTDEELDGPAWFPALTQAGDAVARAVTAGPDQDLEKVEFAVLQAIACARSNIRVMTPYFLPDQQLIMALALAAMRGVAVDVVLPERSDHRLVDWAMRANIGPMLEDGAHVWKGPSPFRHSKVMVVDSQWCLIGSSNWDMRSFRLNFELCVEVYDERLAAELEALMVNNRGRRLELTELNARGLPVRLRDAGVRLLLPYL